MAIDRFIYWKDKKPENRGDIELIIEDYFGGICTITADPDRLFVNLPGKPTHPLSRIKIYSDCHRLIDQSLPERWIEVYFGDNNIDIITRQQDEFTNTLANGLAELFARVYQTNIT